MHAKLKLVLPTEPPPNPPKVWQCDVCKRFGVWGEGWAWYGTMDEIRFITCSDRCKAEAERRGIYY